MVMMSFPVWRELLKRYCTMHTVISSFVAGGNIN